MTPFLHPSLHLQLLFTYSKLVFSIPGTVRIHHNLAARFPSARLWYFLRSQDKRGRGVISFDIEAITSIFLDCGKSTLYQWLREGKELGFFRAYRKDRKSGFMRVFLGGLHAVCLKNNLSDFGKVGLVPVAEILSLHRLRATASAIVTQALQNESRYAAKHKLRSREKHRRVISPRDIFDWNAPTCLKSGKRVPGNSIIHVSKKIAFVGSRFIPFGVSQPKIAEVIGRSERTLRRYLSYPGIERRQICQTRAEFAEINTAMKWDTQFFKTGEVELVSTKEGYQLLDGKLPLKSIPYVGISEGKLFNYAGCTWLRRCNIYQLNERICTMSAARKVLGKLIKKNRAADPSPKGLDRMQEISFSNSSGIFEENLKQRELSEEPG